MTDYNLPYKIVYKGSIDGDEKQITFHFENEESAKTALAFARYWAKNNPNEEVWEIRKHEWKPKQEESKVIKNEEFAVAFWKQIQERDEAAKKRKVEQDDTF